MNIAIITSCSFPASEGLGTHVRSIAEYFVSIGNSVEVLIRSPGYGEIKRLKERGVDYVIVPSTTIPVISSFIFKKKCERLLSRPNREIDVLHYHSPLVLPLNINTSANVVTTVHSTMLEDTKHIEIMNFKSILYKLMGRFISPYFERSLFRVSSKVIAVSAGVKDELQLLYNLSPNHVEIIPNGIDLTLFQPTASVADKQNMIVYVGRIGFRKGIPELLEAIHELRKELHSYKFLFIGTGDLDHYLLEKIKEYNLEDIIDWKKNVPQKELPNVLSQSKFLIMPSAYETGPRVVLESISCLTPPIATQVGLVPLITDDAYISIDDSTVEKIKISIRKAVSLEQEIYEKYIRACDLERSKYDVRVTCQEILKVYER